MTPETWQQVDELFKAALEREPDDRAAYLRRACNGDEALRREVESLLSAYEQGGSFMEAPAVAAAAHSLLAEKGESLVGRLLRHYRVICLLGDGGMGQVYLAEDARLGRKVALKLLPPQFTADAERVRRFTREARAASALNHPNICTIYEIDDEHSPPFIAMEYVEGETLSETIKGGRLDLTETLPLALQIADALAEAHTHNIIHRDIKPQNIVINQRGQAKVLDFGLAKKIATESGAETPQPLSSAGMILGTAAYMSPEQARGLWVDARTDIWSLGICLYEMLTGRRPFEGETTTDTLAAVLHHEPAPLSENTSPELQRIVAKALQKNRDERYQSAKDLLADLKALQKLLEFEAEPGGASSPNKSPVDETRMIREDTTAPTETRNSIAVLPFANMSAEAGNEYFCDGLAEELLNALAKIEDLQVAARTSAFSFKNKNVEVSEIGRALHVKTVLEGSVRKSGDRLRITVQLINAADGYHLWSERYDRELKDIFVVQDEITLAVVDALKVKLLGEEKAAMLRRYTDNPEAYELYLKGLYHSNKWTDEGLRKSTEYFEKALEKDPDFAPAYAKIADYYHFSSHIGLFSPQEIFPKWKAAAERALEIDEGLADAHLAMAHIYFYYERDWAKAEREYGRAVELNPNSTDAHKYYGLFLASRERFDQAVAEAKKALELDPLSIAVNIVAGFVCLFANRTDDALGLVRQMIELDSNAPQGYWVGGTLFMANGNNEEAVEALKRSLSLGDNQMALAKLGCAYGLAGRRDEALKILDQLFEMRERQYAAPFNIARVYAGLGLDDDAFEWMGKAVEERDAELVFLKRLAEAGEGLYFGKGFPADPRYQQILRRAGLPAQERQADDTDARVERAGSPTNRVAQEVQATTPERRNRTAQTTPSFSERSKQKKLLLILALLGLLIGLGAIAYYLLVMGKTSGDRKSIAVLPVSPINTASRDEIYEIGIADSLINRLSSIKGFVVRPLSATRKYADIEQDPIAAGREQQVNYVLASNYQLAAGKIRITAQLFNVGNGQIEETYKSEKDASDLFAMQDAVARDVGRLLQARFGLTSGTPGTKRRTTNEEAYRLYLQGMYVVEIRHTLENAQKAVEVFERAVELDPDYAQAWAGKAYAHRAVANFVGRNASTHEHTQKSMEAIKRALSLDENVAEAYSTLCENKMYYNYDFVEAESACKRGIELNPNSPLAHQVYSRYLVSRGRFDEAITEIKTTIDLEPASLFHNSLYGINLYYARRYPEAIAQFKRVLALDENYGHARYWLTVTFAAQGNESEAFELFMKDLVFYKADEATIQAFQTAYQSSGWRGVMQEEAKRFEQGDERYFFGAYYNAQAGNKDKAFEYLEKSYQRREMWMAYLQVDPRLGPLRDDPRFDELVRRFDLR